MPVDDSKIPATSRRPEHPGREALGRFARGKAAGKEMRGVVAHLLGGCAECGTTLAGIAPELVLDAPLDRLQASYQEAIARAAAAARRREGELRREQALTRSFLPVLYGQPKARKLLLLRNSERGRAWAVCEELLATSFTLQRQDPSRMVELAELAFRVASELDGERYGATLVVDLQARAAAELANALRVSERLDLALPVMIGALQLLHHGSGDPLLRARIYDLAAPILKHRRRLDLAVSLLERAFRIYRRFGENHLAGQVLLERAITEGHRAQPAFCLDLLVQAVELIDPQQDRRLAWTAIHNLLWGLAELGRCEAAAELLDESRSLYDEFADRWNEPVRLWLEGRIAAGLGREQQAELRFLDASAGLARAGRLLEAARVDLELMLLLGSQGRGREVEALVGDLVRSFRAQKAEREALAAVLALKDALGSQRTPFFLIKKLQEYFRRLSHEPELRFDQVLA